VAKLLKLRQNNQSWRRYRLHHLRENKWRAMRYGMQGKLIDFGKKEEVPMNLLTLEILDFVDDVLDELGSREEIAHIHAIIKDGTSADRQILVYEDAKENGASDQEALQAIVDHLTVETMRGL